MTTALQVLDAARSQLGVKESPAGSNKTPYGKWYGMDGNPWCAMFVSWCFNKAGMPLHITTDKGYAYCPFGVNYFKNINRWSTTPAVGAIVFYGSNGKAEHTGIVESFTNTTITAIEGNTAVGNDANGGEVMRRVRQRNTWVVGYGLPDYQSTEITQTTKEEDEVPSKFVHEFRWESVQGAPVVKIDREGRAYCYGLAYQGGVDRVPADGKKAWADGEGTVRPVDINDPGAGYVIYSEDARFEGTFTPAWWAANKH